MEPRIIETKGFNFHCPENRSYVFFDPQDQSERERLDAILGATEIFETAIEKLKTEMPKGRNTIAPFLEIHPVGLTNLGEIVAVVLQGAVGLHKIKAPITETGLACATSRRPTRS